MLRYLSVFLFTLTATSALANVKFSSEKTPFETLDELYRNGRAAKMSDIGSVQDVSADEQSAWKQLIAAIKVDTKVESIGSSVSWLILQELKKPDTAASGPLFPTKPGTVLAKTLLSCPTNIYLAKDCRVTPDQAQAFYDNLARNKYGLEETATDLKLFYFANNSWTSMLMRINGDYLIIRTETQGQLPSYTYAWKGDAK